MAGALVGGRGRARGGRGKAGECLSEASYAGSLPSRISPRPSPPTAPLAFWSFSACEKDSAKKNRNHPGRSRQGATLQVDDHHLRTETNELPTESEGAERGRTEKRPCSGLTVQGRFEFIRGGYLLSHFRSTIGAAGFNFSVRNGKRWNPRAMNHLSIFQSTRIFGERLGAASTGSLCRIR